MKLNTRDTILIPIALVCGGAIAYVDSRPQWDDTGITAGALFLLCAVLAYLSPGRWWIWMLAVGLWIPLLSGLPTGNYGTFLALLVAGLGAITGRAIGMSFQRRPMPLA